MNLTRLRGKVGLEAREDKGGHIDILQYTYRVICKM